jgi:maltose O-acetyltransferase
VYFNRRVFVEAIVPVTIGDECAFGMETMILTSHHPFDRYGKWQHEAVGRPVVIGDKVWVGARAIILPGAVVESDVIIAAGAVVTGRCASHGVYAGVPARRIRDFPVEPTA